MNARIAVGFLSAATAALAGVLAQTPAGASSPVLINDSQIHAISTTDGGASPLNTDKTVPHWFGQAQDPQNGITYGYNMAGIDPSLNASVTVPTDVIPLNLVVGGMAFNGSDRVAGLLASPLFQPEDFSTTSAASDASLNRGAGGALSPGNAGVQLVDAQMRSQFNKAGTGYHLTLATPVVHDAIVVPVSSNHGVVMQNPRGILFADVGLSWFQSEIGNLLNQGYIDPTHLPIFITNDVVLYSGNNIFNCCVFGFHGATRSRNGNGNQGVQTLAWASWLSPGLASQWALQDISGVSHEISEWASDPFANNFVAPWQTATAQFYGCTGKLESGDPAVGIGFSAGTNTVDQGPAPDGVTYADGTYHPQDELLLPWFMRSAPNTISQPTQTSSVEIGRYSFLGDLNPFAALRGPATGC
jgi:hypothetical protein